MKTSQSIRWWCDHTEEEVIVPEVKATDGMCCCGVPVDWCQTPHVHKEMTPLDRAFDWLFKKVEQFDAWIAEGVRREDRG